MDHAGFQDWLNRYIEAWRSTDPGAIGALFSEDATYSYGPYRDPVVGREAIVRDWTADPDEPGSWEAEYRPLAVDGDTAVSIGESRYANGKKYSNIFVCRFDARRPLHRLPGMVHGAAEVRRELTLSAPGGAARRGCRRSAGGRAPSRPIRTSSRTNVTARMIAATIARTIAIRSSRIPTERSKNASTAR